MESLLYHPREVATAYLVAVALLLPLIAWRLARRSRWAPLVWTMGSYLALLHLMAAVSLSTSRLFESGIAPMTLLTFPASFFLAGSYVMPGFETLPDLWANYLRLIVFIGGCNTVFAAAFVRLLTGPPKPFIPRADQRKGSLLHTR